MMFAYGYYAAAFAVPITAVVSVTILSLSTSQPEKDTSDQRQLESANLRVTSLE